LNYNKPVERSDPTVPPTFEFPVFEAEDESEDDIPDEITRRLNRRKKPFSLTRKRLSWSTWVPRTISERSRLVLHWKRGVKRRIFQLLREYSDIFAWSYEDMTGLDPQIVEHRIPTKPECPPVRQKLRRTRPDMALKIKGEV